MKKNLLAILAAAAAFAACSKEIQLTVSAPASEEAAGQVVYTLSATAPQTKATLNETSGAFAWESGDEIAVYDNAQSKYQIFSTTESGASAEFSFLPTDNLTHDFVGSAAYYPVSRLNAAQTAVAGPFDIPCISAASEVPMTATNNNGSLSFDYQAAVVKLTVNNVPSFAESVEFINNGQSYAGEINHSASENMVFYFAVDESNSKASSISFYDTAGNEFLHKDFNLSKNAVAKGDLIPLKTTIGYPILVENNTDWGGLDIYCYSATDDWTNAAWGSTLSTVYTVTIGSKTYSYILAKNTSDSYSFVFRKPNNDYPRVEHKGVAVSGETFLTLNTQNGARVAGDSTPRIIVFNQDKIGPVYIHYWGNGISGTNWDPYASREMIYLSEGHMVMSAKCTGLIYTGNAMNNGNWYFYYDFADFGNASSFNFRLHQGENMGSEFSNVSTATNMYYGWWNHDQGGGNWGAGAWAM